VGVQDAGSLIVGGKYRVAAVSANPSGLSTIARRLRPRYSRLIGNCVQAASQTGLRFSLWVTSAEHWGTLATCRIASDGTE